MSNNTFEDFLVTLVDNLPEKITGSQLSGLFAMLLTLYKYDDLVSTMILLEAASKLGMAQDKLNQIIQEGGNDKHVIN